MALSNFKFVSFNPKDKKVTDCNSTNINASIDEK